MGFDEVDEFDGLTQDGNKVDELSQDGYKINELSQDGYKINELTQDGYKVNELTQDGYKVDEVDDGDDDEDDGDDGDDDEINENEGERLRQDFDEDDLFQYVRRYDNTNGLDVEEVLSQGLIDFDDLVSTSNNAPDVYSFTTSELEALGEEEF